MSEQVKKGSLRSHKYDSAHDRMMAHISGTHIMMDAAPSSCIRV